MIVMQLRNPVTCEERLLDAWSATVRREIKQFLLVSDLPAVLPWRQQCEAVAVLGRDMDSCLEIVPPTLTVVAQAVVQLQSVRDITISHHYDISCDLGYMRYAVLSNMTPTWTVCLLNIGRHEYSIRLKQSKDLADAEHSTARYHGHFYILSKSLQKYSNLGPILTRFRDIIRAFVFRKPLFSAPYPYSGENFGVFSLE